MLRLAALLILSQLPEPGKLAAQFNYYRLSVEIDAGPTFPYVDVPEQGRVNFLLNTMAGLNLGPYTILNAAFTRGILSGNDSRDARAFKNSFWSIATGISVELGQVNGVRKKILLKPLRTFFLAAGAGLQQNEQANIVRSLITPAGRVYRYTGHDRSREAVLPVTTGFRIYFRDFWGRRRISLSLSYRVTFVKGDGLDGYDDSPLLFDNQHSDRFDAVLAGISYHFGFIGLSP